MKEGTFGRYVEAYSQRFALLFYFLIIRARFWVQLNILGGIMTTNLYFVRHAHSIYTPEELTRPLSEQGWKDAARVGELLKREDIHHVISSPYLRAIQTVEGIASECGQKIQLVEEFKERKLAAGVMKDFNHAIKTVWENPIFHWEGGESNVTAQKRGVQATKIILDKYEGQNVVIGTHGNIMVLIMNHFDEQYGFEFWKQLAMPDIYKLSFEHDRFVGCSRIWEESSEMEVK